MSWAICCLLTANCGLNRTDLHTFMNSHHDWSSYRENVLCEVHTQVQEITAGTEADDTVQHCASNMVVNIKYKCSKYYNCKGPHLQYFRQMILHLLLRYGENLTMCVKYGLLENIHKEYDIYKKQHSEYTRRVLLCRHPLTCFI